jgi:hypothetical protein
VPGDGGAFGEELEESGLRSAGSEALREMMVEEIDHALRPTVHERRVASSKHANDTDMVVMDETGWRVGTNHDLLSAMAEVTGDGVLAARLEPSDRNCCVRHHTSRPTQWEAGGDSAPPRLTAGDDGQRGQNVSGTHGRHIADGLAGRYCLLGRSVAAAVADGMRWAGDVTFVDTGHGSAPRLASAG